MVIGSVLSFAIIFFFISLEYLPFPFVWIALSFFLVLLFASKLCQKTFFKVLWVNISAIILALGIYESYLQIKNDNSTDKIREVYSRDYVSADEILGYSPPKNTVGYWKKYHEEDLIYDINYTIDSDGLRISPPL